MKLSELKRLSEEKNFRISTKEEYEYEHPEEENEFYKLLRENGFYRVYDTFYKDVYTQCFEFYCTGFCNSEEGYNWLISISDDDDNEDIDLDKTIFDLYIVTKGNNKYNRKDKKVFTGLAKDILAYSKKKDKEGYKIAVRQNEKDEVLEKMYKQVDEETKKMPKLEEISLDEIKKLQNE